MRADAVRNRERLVKVAAAAFAEHGTDASLDDIAKRAEVGPGTLYRHFPTRQALLEAVYRGGVERHCAEAATLGETLEPGPALAAWMRMFAGYLREKRGLSGALLSTMDKSSELFVSTHQMLYDTAGPLLERAKEAGEIRPDVTLSDLFKLINGIGLSTERLDDGLEQADRLLSIVFDGLRTLH
jgi:AcrR family transcriptional regulator